MNRRSLRSTALACALGLLFALAPLPARADALSDLEAQIARDQAQLALISSQTISVRGEIADTQSKIARLQSILSQLNAQLLAINARLSDNQVRLDDLIHREAVLTDQLNATEARMREKQAAFAGQVRVLDKVEGRSPVGMILTSHDFGQFLQRLTGIRQVADGTQVLADQLKADRDTLAAQRAELGRQKAEQTRVVAAMQQQKQALDREYAIQNSATLQLYSFQAQQGQQQASLDNQATGLTADIASAETQIQSLLAFSHGQGGNVVPPEYLANGWGTYFNQRDARWGNVYLGRSSYEVWEIGCLLTSVAMVNSHFGFTRVTPGVIAANPQNFTSGGLLYNSALDVPGHPADIHWNPSRAYINGILARGGTVIVGMNIRTGGTHFVVIVAQNGPYDYWINDPWVQNAMHVSFNSSPVTGPIYDAIGYL